MSEAPERIWVWWDDGYDIGLVNTHGDERYTPKDAREYVRASRIEQLAAINEELGQACAKWAEVSQSNYQRAKAAEAKLAKAVKALDEAWFMLTVPHLNYEPEPEEPGLRRIKTTLAELKERRSE